MAYYQTKSYSFDLLSKVMEQPKTFLKRIAEKRERARNIAELKALGPSALQDLGLHRSEVSSIVNQPHGGRRREHS